MKPYLLPICFLFLLCSCGGNEKKTGSTESDSASVASPQLSLTKVPFKIDTIECFVYENTPEYVRLETSDVLSEDAIKKVVDTLGYEVTGNIFYFHINGIRDRGAEYATYMTQNSYLSYADKVVRNQFDLRLQKAADMLMFMEANTTLTMDVVPTIVAGFKEVAEYLEEAEIYMTPSSREEQASLAKLKKRFAADKRKFYPMMRRAYFKKAKSVMWEEDVEVKMRGDNVLYFYSGIFFTNKNKKEAYTAIYDMVRDLRFKRVCFGPYEGGEYTYWNVYEGNDAD